MLLKVNGSYLNFSGEVDIDKQAKLFEELDASTGDVSYDIEVEITNENLSLLGIQSIDTAVKNIYKNVSCIVETSGGIPVYYGSLQITDITDKIECTFYSGNSNWIDLISGSIKDLDFSEYTISYSDITTTNSTTEGIIVPFVDRGILVDRIGNVLNIQRGTSIEYAMDYQPFIYAKTAMKKIFAGAGLKLAGSLLNDYRYNNLIFTSNVQSQQSIIDSRTCYVGKSATQAITVYALVTFPKETDPYFDGDNNNYDSVNSIYTSDINVVVYVNVYLEATIVGSYEWELRVNGVAILTQGFINIVNYGDQFELSSGDTIEVYARAVVGTLTLTTNTYFRVSPLIFLDVIPQLYVPPQEKIDFVSNIIKMFNVIPTYDYFSKTVYLNKFTDIVKKDAIDISQYLKSIDGVNFTETVENYAQNSLFEYNQIDTLEQNTYNQGNTVPYGCGVMQIDNDFIPSQKTVVEIDAAAPFSYLNVKFNTELLNLGYVTENELTTVEVTSVTNSGGLALFNYTGDFNGLTGGNAVRVNTTLYVGNGIVLGTGAGVFSLAGVSYIGNSTGSATKFEYEENTSEDVVFALVAPNTAVTNFSSLSNIAGLSSVAYAWFDKAKTGRNIDNIIHGLAFDTPNQSGKYQRTLLQDYYPDVQRIMNNPVKLKCTFYFPLSVFRRLNFEEPVFLSTAKTSGRYLINKFSGYSESYLPCNVELIKL